MCPKASGFPKPEQQKSQTKSFNRESPTVFPNPRKLHKSNLSLFFLWRGLQGLTRNFVFLEAQALVVRMISSQKWEPDVFASGSWISSGKVRYACCDALIFGSGWFNLGYEFDPLKNHPVLLVLFTPTFRGLERLQACQKNNPQHAGRFPKPPFFREVGNVTIVTVDFSQENKLTAKNGTSQGQLLENFQ